MYGNKHKSHGHGAPHHDGPHNDAYHQHVASSKGSNERHVSNRNHMPSDTAGRNNDLECHPEQDSGDHGSEHEGDGKDLGDGSAGTSKGGMTSDYDGSYGNE
jgi:hypothetical protein